MLGDYRRTSLLGAIDGFLAFADDAFNWWERPLSKAEQRVNFAEMEQDMESAIERTRKQLDRQWTEAVQKAKKEVLGWVVSKEVSPAEILKNLKGLRLDLADFDKTLTAGALTAYGSGERQAAREVRRAASDSGFLEEISILKFADKFPELRGSQKQIEWATSIREKAISLARDHIKSKMPIIQEIGQGARDLYKDLLLNLGKKTDSRFWIDNRQLLSGAAWLDLSMQDFSSRYVATVLEDLKEGKEALGYAPKPRVAIPAQPATAPKVSPDDPYELGDYKGLLEARAFVVSQGMEQKVLQAIATELSNAYASGLPAHEAKTKLDALFTALEAGQLIAPGAPGYDYSKPAIQETTVRTVMADAMNAGRNAVYERNAGYVLGTMRSEVAEGREMGRGGKMRSHPLSKWVDGLTIKLSDPRRRRLTGAVHYNDRGVDIPVTILDEPVEWSSDADIDRALAKGAELSPRFF